MLTNDLGNANIHLSTEQKLYWINVALKNAIDVTQYLEKNKKVQCLQYRNKT